MANNNYNNNKEIWNLVLDEMINADFATVDNNSYEETGYPDWYLDFN